MEIIPLPIPVKQPPLTPPTPFWDAKCCSSFRGNVKLFIVFYFWKVSIGFPSIWLWLRPRNFLFNYQTFDSILKYLLCSTYKCMYVYCVCILIKGSTHSVLAVVVNHFLLSFRACVCVCVWALEETNPRATVLDIWFPKFNDKRQEEQQELEGQEMRADQDDRTG